MPGVDNIAQVVDGEIPTEIVITDLESIEEGALPEVINIAKIIDGNREIVIADVNEIDEVMQEFEISDVAEIEVVDPVTEEVQTVKVINSEAILKDLNPGLYMQLGAFKYLDNAIELKERMEKEFTDVVEIYQHEEGIYRVVLGSLMPDEKGFVANYIRSMGINGFFFTANL